MLTAEYDETHRGDDYEPQKPVGMESLQLI